MPQKIVEVPGMGNVEFPDSMSDDAISTILKGYSNQAPPITGDVAMAQANTRMALANVPRPAAPAGIDQPSMLPYQLATGAKIAGGMIQRGARDLWDTSLGSIQNVYNKNYGTPAEQQEATARLQAAQKNAVLNYAGGMIGEELSPARPFAVRPNDKLIPKLLNASGDVGPDTLANLKAAEPALQAGGVPKSLTREGVASHARKLSTGIDSQIRPIIEANATRDVSSDTSRIASQLRSQITPEMQAVNPGAANAVEKLAKSVEGTKTLGSLDELRQQLNDKVYAVKPNAVFRPYIKSTLNDVLDSIAGHAQQVRPDMPVRSLRSQQSALIKLADTFEESAAKGQAQATAQEGLTTTQKLGQKIPGAIQWLTNPKVAAAKRLIKPSTAEELIQQAYARQPKSAAGSLVKSVTGPDINEIRATGAASRRSNAQWIQDVIRRQGLPVDPMLKDVQAQLQQRAAAFQAQREALGPLGLQSQQTFNPSPNPADIPPVTPYYERYGQVAGPAAAPNTAAATVQHMNALDMAKARLGPNASLSQILQEAAKIQNPGQR